MQIIMHMRRGLNFDKQEFFNLIFYNKNKFRYPMKRTALFLTALLTYTLIFAVNPAKHVDVYKLNVADSKLEWRGARIGGEEKGTIQFKSGELSNDHGKFTGTFVVDMTTITSTDQTGNGKEKLEGHLKSDDFFNVEKHPTAILVINSLTALPSVAKEGYTHTVSGNMTIRDQTHPVTFNSKMVPATSGLVFTGEMAIDRSKYNVKYQSKTFFKDIGDKAINDEFTLKFNVVLTK
jgi:polyisoprenoid-binding protein YceI